MLDCIKPRPPCSRASSPSTPAGKATATPSNSSTPMSGPNCSPPSQAGTRRYGQMNIVAAEGRESHLGNHCRRHVSSPRSSAAALRPLSVRPVKTDRQVPPKILALNGYQAGAGAVRDFSVCGPRGKQSKDISGLFPGFYPEEQRTRL